MTKKDYELIAKTLREGTILYQVDREYVAHDLAEAFSQNNPKFDRDKFLTACGIELNPFENVQGNTLD